MTRVIKRKTITGKPPATKRVVKKKTGFMDEPINSKFRSTQREKVEIVVITDSAYVPQYLEHLPPQEGDFDLGGTRRIGVFATKDRVHLRSSFSQYHAFHDMTPQMARKIAKALLKASDESI